MAVLVPPRVILFDWHSTLVDTAEAMYHAVDDTLQKLGDLNLLERMRDPEDSKTVEDARLIRYVRDNLRLHPKIIAEKRISRTDIFEVLFDNDEWAKATAHEEFNNCYRTHFGEIHPFEEGIDEMLIQLHAMGMKLGVLTNRNREFLEHEISFIHLTGWRRLFDVMVCGDDVERRKPAPDLIFKALDEIGVDPDMSTWYVGDSTTDTITAKSAGVTSIFYNGAAWGNDWLRKIFPGNERYPHKPDAVVNDFKEFYRLVESTLKEAASKE
jgi:phosphoglycolate phosphatase